MHFQINSKKLFKLLKPDTAKKLSFDKHMYCLCNKKTSAVKLFEVTKIKKSLSLTSVIQILIIISMTILFSEEKQIKRSSKTKIPKNF